MNHGMVSSPMQKSERPNHRARCCRKSTNAQFLSSIITAVEETRSDDKHEHSSAASITGSASSSVVKVSAFELQVDFRSANLEVARHHELLWFRASGDCFAFSGPLTISA